jgi:hypothetical protein
VPTTLSIGYCECCTLVILSASSVCGESSESVVRDTAYVKCTLCLPNCRQQYDAYAADNNDDVTAQYSYTAANLRKCHICTTFAVVLHRSRNSSVMSTSMCCFVDSMSWTVTEIID